MALLPFHEPNRKYSDSILDIKHVVEALHSKNLERSHSALIVVESNTPYKWSSHRVDTLISLNEVYFEKTYSSLYSEVLI
jgi:hypothetical protein